MEKIEQKEENLEKQEKKSLEGETKEVSNLKNKKSNKKMIIFISVVCVIILMLLIVSTIFALLNMNNSKIVSGVKIEGIDISGLTIDEAKSKIDTIYKEKKEKSIDLQYKEYETEISPELIETNYDIEKALNEAISIGKNNNIFINNYNIIFALLGKKDINVNMTINEDAAKQSIEDIEKNIPGVVEESDYYIEDTNLVITKGKEGVKIDTENLLKEIKDVLNDIHQNQECIEIPVINKKPEEINIEKIHEEVYKEVKDAYYTKDPFKIYTEVEGIDFNVEEAKKIIESEEKDQYTIKLTITKPKVTIADIGSEAFPDLIAKFTTRYDASNSDRTTNLRLACQKLDNKVILPGETFSYNKALGERSTTTGYKNAKVYENGEVVDGIGGGICQISSTLYNAVLMSNMNIVERRNHQFITSYLPAGRDATVVYGLTDFKFKNTRTYAVKIKASVSSGIATISIYGIKQENEYSVSFETKTISTIPYTIKYVDDLTIANGTEKVKQKGANGVITETYIIKSLNGKVVSRELLSKDTYNAMQRIILRGTKGNTTNNAPVNTQANPSTTNQPQQQEQTQKPVEEPTVNENKTEIKDNNVQNNQV